MLALLGISLFSLLLLGIPFMVVLLASALFGITFGLPGFDLSIMVQQVVGGIKPQALVAIPMFIMAAEIITSGQSAKRLIRIVKAFLGHIPGGLPITTNASCTLFASISGSTQGTVAAIGKVMRPLLLEAGYSSSFSLGLIINASDIALMIPPSIGFIVYGVATKTSVGKLFLAGILPGILIFVLFSIYSFFYSKIKKIGLQPRASWKERFDATKDGILLLGFPVVIIGGIYSGIFTPTEAAAVSVAYALIIEGFVYRSLTWKIVKNVLLSTGLVTSVVFILVGGGQALSWLISYLRIPQTVLPALFGQDPSLLKVMAIIVVVYFVACMFVDPIVAIFVFSPIFAPYVVRAGVDPIVLGVLVTLQAAMGSATPPFGCDIFTAQLLFRRPYLEVIGHTYQFTFIEILVTVIIIAFPQIALWIPNLAMGG
jgi:C4-dicarboxylate transporter DctM subunit